MLSVHLFEAILSHYTVQELHITRQTTPAFQIAADRVLQARFPRLKLSFILRYTAPNSLYLSHADADNVRYITASTYTARIEWTSSVLTQLPLVGRTQFSIYSTYHECPLFSIQRTFPCSYANSDKHDVLLLLLYDVVAQHTDHEIVWCDLRDPAAIAIYNFTVNYTIARHLQTIITQLAPTGQALVTDSGVLYCDGTLVPLDIQPGTRLVWKNGALYGDDTILHVLH